jgi:hypothetical protein
MMRSVTSGQRGAPARRQKARSTGRSAAGGAARGKSTRKAAGRKRRL